MKHLDHEINIGRDEQGLFACCYEHYNEQQAELYPSFKIPSTCYACSKYIQDDVSDDMIQLSAPSCSDKIDNKTCRYRYCKAYVEYIDNN